MRAICLYLHLHQPWRYERYSVFDVAHDHNYWDEIDYYDKQNNQRIFDKVCEKSYHPMLNLLEENIRKHKNFKVSLSITGTWLEQAELWHKDLIHQIRRMVKTGQCEIVAETYDHSLSFFYSKEEFAKQVKMHTEKIKALFGTTPKVFVIPSYLTMMRSDSGVPNMVTEPCLPKVGIKSSVGVRRTTFTR